MKKISRRACLVSLAAACGTSCVTRGTSLRQLQIAPGATLAPWVGLNVITYGAIDPLVLDHLAAIGVPLTLRCPVRSMQEVIALTTSLAPYPTLRAILLVEITSDQLISFLADAVRALPPCVYAISLGNELDLAGVSPASAHAFAQRSYGTLRAGGFAGDIFAPSIYCVQPDHLHDYAFPMWENLPADMVFDLHRYGDPDSGQDGYKDRIDEVQTIRNTIGLGRRVVISECGWPTRTAADIEWTLRAAVVDRRYAHLLGAIGWCYYQLLDGTGATDIDHYGLRRTDGSWKGLEAIFA